MRKLLYVVLLAVVGAGCTSAFWNPQTPEEAEAATQAVQTLTSLGISFMTPAQAALGNAITAVATGLTVWLGRNHTRKAQGLVPHEGPA